MIKDFSNVLIFVVLSPIISTTPSTFDTFIQSFIFRDLSANNVKPPKRFAAVSLAASANAKPPKPKDATKALTFIPQICKIATKPIETTTIFITFTINILISSCKSEPNRLVKFLIYSSLIIIESYKIQNIINVEKDLNISSIRLF